MTISREEPRMSLPVRLSLLICAAALAWGADPVAAQTLKIATIAPESSSWMRDMRAAAKVIEEHTDGRVRFKFYGGGVQGNDKQVLRKMRIGQLHGGAVLAGSFFDVTANAEIYKLPLSGVLAMLAGMAGCRAVAPPGSSGAARGCSRPRACRWCADACPSRSPAR